MLFDASLGTTKPSLGWQAHLGAPVILQDPMVVSMIAVKFVVFQCKSIDASHIRLAVIILTTPYGTEEGTRISWANLPPASFSYLIFDSS